MAVDFKVVNNNVPAYLTAFERQVAAGLMAIGATAEKHAKANCPVDTGRLRNSITYATADYMGNDSYTDKKKKQYSGASAKARAEKKTVYIGTNVEYAPIQEFYSMSHKTGRAHFLRDAATQHGAEYKNIMETALKT